jgi:hypothetical protein
MHWPRTSVCTPLARMVSAKAPAASAVPPNESSNTTVRTVPLPSCSVKSLMAVPSSMPATTSRLPCSVEFGGGGAREPAMPNARERRTDRTQPEICGGFMATFGDLRGAELAAWNAQSAKEFAQSLQLEQRRGMPSTVFSEIFG